MNDTILLVEDEENDVFFLQRAWKKAGITSPLHVVNSGQAAIDYLNSALIDGEPNAQPSLVLLDLKLPVVMGLEVLKWIRRQPRFEKMAVVIFTSSKIDSDIEAAYRLGANSYLVKPNTSDKLLEMVQLIKHYWLNVPDPFSACAESKGEFACR